MCDRQFSHTHVHIHIYVCEKIQKSTEDQGKGTRFRASVLIYVTIPGVDRVNRMTENVIAYI